MLEGLTSYNYLQQKQQAQQLRKKMGISVPAENLHAFAPDYMIYTFCTWSYVVPGVTTRFILRTNVLLVSGKVVCTPMEKVTPCWLETPGREN